MEPRVSKVKKKNEIIFSFLHLRQRAVPVGWLYNMRCDNFIFEFYFTSRHFFFNTIYVFCTRHVFCLISIKNLVTRRHNLFIGHAHFTSIATRLMLISNLVQCPILMLFQTGTTLGYKSVALLQAFRGKSFLGTSWVRDNLWDSKYVRKRSSFKLDRRVLRCVF